MHPFSYMPPRTAELSPELPFAVNKMIQKDLADGLVSCAAAAVVCKDKLVYRNFFGNAGENTPVNATSLFRMASMTKPVTAVCVMRQIEEGKLSLEDSVETYIPALANMQVGEANENGELVGSHPSPRPFTVKDLLTHSSGLGSGVLFDRLFWRDHELHGTIGDMAGEWGSAYLQFDPGSAFSYSGLVGFDVLAHLVELTSDLPYEEYARKYLFAPLDMNDTCFTPTPEQWNRMVQMHATEEGKAVPVDMGNHVFGNLPLTYHSGGAGLVSSLDDYTRFAHMLTCDGTSFGVRILREETVKSMRIPQLPYMTPGTDETYSWGLSMRVATADNGSQAPLRKDSYGWSGAYGTHFWCDPVRQICAVYCSNMTTAGGSGALTARHMEKAVMDNLGDLRDCQ